MDIIKTNLFPYIEGDFLVGLKDVVLTMKFVSSEMLPTHNGKSEEKFVLYFEETDKGLVLNKTNCKTIVSLYGKLTEDWSGKQIALYGEKVNAFGDIHNATRIHPTVPAKKNGNGNGNGKKAKADKPMPEQTEQPLTAEDEAELDAIFGVKQSALIEDATPAGSEYKE